jgi:hypothetical protein
MHESAQGGKVEGSCNAGQLKCTNAGKSMETAQLWLQYDGIIIRSGQTIFQNGPVRFNATPD